MKFELGNAKFCGEAGMLFQTYCQNNAVKTRVKSVEEGGKSKHKT
jgi:hypothetical protein